MEQQEGARRIVRDCIGIKPDDQVLLITDTGRPPAVEQALYEACIEAGAIPKRLSFDGVISFCVIFFDCYKCIFFEPFSLPVCQSSWYFGFIYSVITNRRRYTIYC